MPPRTRRTTDRPPTRRTTSSPRSPRQGRASHPRLASPPTAEERVRRTNEYRASRSRARAYRDGLRAAAAAAPAPAPAQPAPAESPRSRARNFAQSQGWLTGSVDDVDDVDVVDNVEDDADAAAAARARRRESEGLADELVYPGGLTTFEDSDDDARAAQRGDAKAPRDNQAAFFGVLAALAISLLAVVARVVSDAAAAALEGVAEVRDTLAQPRVYIAIVGFGVAAASIYKRVQTLIERRALAEDLLEAAVAALEDARRLPGSRARVPCDHLRDALIRARWPLAGAKRRAALKAWAIVIRELDSDARIRAVNVQVAGRRMKHFEYVARVRTATPK